jgi:hypothetical protein
MSETITWVTKTVGWNWISSDRQWEILRDYTQQGHVVFVVWKIRPNHEIIDKASSLRVAKQRAQDEVDQAEAKRFASYARALRLHGLGGLA